MMTIGELQQALESYPDRLRHALQQQIKAEREVDRLQEEIDEIGEEPSDDLDEPETPLQIKYEKAKLRYDQKRANVELDLRRSPPAGMKITESTIYAFLASDEDLCNMKEKLIDLEAEAKASRHLISVKEPKPLDPKKLKEQERLEAKLLKAQEAKDEADIEVEVLKAELSALRILTQILAPVRDLAAV